MTNLHGQMATFTRKAWYPRARTEVLWVTCMGMRDDAHLSQLAWANDVTQLPQGTIHLKCRDLGPFKTIQSTFSLQQLLHCGASLNADKRHRVIRRVQNGSATLWDMHDMKLWGFSKNGRNFRIRLTVGHGAAFIHCCGSMLRSCNVLW